MHTWMWVVIVLAIVIVALAALAWTMRQRRQSQQLHETFGPEYDRAVSQYHRQDRAEAALLARQERVEAMTIRPLTPQDRTHFLEAWRQAQAQFVDEPATATAEADKLIADLMEARGYPVHDFEQQADDLSVHYPTVVEHYRAAHAVSLASTRGAASTEDLRTAMLHYRALFDELLETTAPDGEEATATPADATPANSAQVNSVPADGAQVNSVPANSAQVNGANNGAPANAAPANAAPANGANNAAPVNGPLANGANNAVPAEHTEVR